MGFYSYAAHDRVPKLIPIRVLVLPHGPASHVPHIPEVHVPRHAPCNIYHVAVMFWNAYRKPQRYTFPDTPPATFTM